MTRRDQQPSDHGRAGCHDHWPAEWWDDDAASRALHDDDAVWSLEDPPVWDADGPDDDLLPVSLPGTALARPGDALAVLLALAGPERRGPLAVWIVLVDEHDRCLPIVLPVSEIPGLPDRDEAHGMFELLGSVLHAEGHPDGGVVAGIVRSGGGDRGATEDAWRVALEAGAAAAGVRLLGVAAIGAARARMLQWH